MNMQTPFIAPDKPWLAPLAGYSDLPFRLLCREMGAAVAVTEMVSAKGLIYENRGTDALLATCEADSPLVAQLFGAEPETLARAVTMLRERGFSAFDLNAGCSVPKVAKADSGAGLLKGPKRLVRILEAMVRAAGPCPVGVKYRLGWDNEIFLELGQALEEAGAAWLTLHPRTARQGFSGKAAWDRLALLRQAVAIPVMASGDLFNAADARACLELSGVDGLMFARGAMADPAVFAKYLALLDGRPEPVSDGPFLASLIRRHAELIEEYGDGRRDLLKMRTLIPRYVRSLAGARELRKRIVSLTTTADIHKIVEEIKSLG